MLRYNIRRVLELKDIRTPLTYLMKKGFTRGVASGLLKEKHPNIRLTRIEKLCNVLKCTPDDLMEWIPDKPEDNRPDHPLAYLRKEYNEENVFSLIRNLPLDKLRDIEQTIKDRLSDK